MADQHIGYPGSVNAAQLATWMPNVSAAQYSVEGLFDGQVVTNNIGDRGITIKPGTIIGDGIMDVFENNTNLNLGSVASGSPDRWDMVVLRRTWNATPGASTSIYTIIPGGPNRTLPARNNNKGVLSDQPIALCRVKAGSTAVQEIVDLRCWASNGGVQAIDELVMSYLDQVGTELFIGGKQWTRSVTTTGNVATSSSWVPISQLQTVQLHATGAALFGGTPPNGQQFRIVAGTIVMQTDGAGYARLTWPQPFPKGLLSVVIMNGDNWALGRGGTAFEASGNPAHGDSAFGSKVDFVYVLHGYNNGFNDGPLMRLPNMVHRINYIAIGW